VIRSVQIVGLSLLALMAIQQTPARAADLYAPGNWPSLAADRKSAEKGDILTVVIYENATATNTASTGSKKNTKLSGSLSAGHSLDEHAALNWDGASGNQGATERSGQMVAQMSVVVDDVLANGDLLVSGSQLININGEKTTIKVKGRVRPADISPQNAVLSTRLADAMIDYDGSGFVSRSGKPGIISRLFNWMGLL
jgi:flagellar L-ring protein precursor FlgH